MAAEEGTPPLAVLDDKKWKVENVEGTMDEPKVRAGWQWQRSSSWVSTLAQAGEGGAPGAAACLRRLRLKPCVRCVCLSRTATRWWRSPSRRTRYVGWPLKARVFRLFRVLRVLTPCHAVAAVHLRVQVQVCDHRRHRQGQQHHPRCALPARGPSVGRAVSNATDEAVCLAPRPCGS